MKTETLHCYGCGTDFTRTRTRGVKPLRCPPCKTGKAAVKGAPKKRGAKPVEGPGYGLARKITDYRIAIELAKPAIRLGKYDEALAALEQVTR